MQATGGFRAVTDERLPQGGTPCATIGLARAVLDHAPAPALVIDAAGRPVYANPMAAGLAAGIDRNLFPEIGHLAARALESGAGLVEVQTFPVRGGSASLELTVLPLTDGCALVLPRDISLDRNLRDALVESRQRYRDIVDISSDFAWETDAAGKFVFVSPRGALDYTADDLVGLPPARFLAPVDQDGDLSVFTAHQPMQDVEVWFRRRDGAAACLSVSAKPLFDAEGRWRGARGLCQDVTDERAAQRALARARNRDRLMTYIVRTIRDELEPRNMMARAAEASSRALAAEGCHIYRIGADGSWDTVASHGVAPQTVLLQSATDRLAGGEDAVTVADHHHRLLARATRYGKSDNGAVVFLRPADHAPFDADDAGLIAEVADQLGIALEQAANHERIVTLSRTDGMTGLLNRRAFFEELERRFDRLRRDRRPAALMYVDMDNFKHVNDVHGHKRGDEAILALCDMLRANTRPGDLAARLGGDEFVVWLEGVDRTAAGKRAEGLLLESWGLQQFSGSAARPLGISLGIAVYDPYGSEALDDLIGRADGAMYEVKHGGKGSFKIAGAARPLENGAHKAAEDGK